jgi:hypothetical protein
MATQVHFSLLHLPVFDVYRFTQEHDSTCKIGKLVFDWNAQSNEIKTKLMAFINEALLQE